MKLKIFPLINLLLLVSLIVPQSTLDSQVLGAGLAPDVVYSISGRVIDSLGNPVPNLTIQATGCDLTKQPVLLIHGWGTPDGPDNILDDEGGFAKLYQWMSADGYVLDCNLFFTTGINFLNTPDQNRQAIQQNLRQAYDQLRLANPQWQGHFDIIGHSYGGLNARFYLESDYYQQDQAYGIHIDNLFTLGSPHGGALPQEAYIGAGKIVGGHIFSPKNRYDFLSALQLTSIAMDWYNFHHQQPENVCYRLVGGDFLQQADVPKGIKFLYSPYGQYPGDIAVSLRSSRWLGVNGLFGFTYPHVSLITNQDMHGYEPGFGLDGLDSYVNPQTTYTQTIRSNLGSRECPETSLESSRALQPHQPQENIVSPILLASGVVNPNQITSGHFSVDWYGRSVFYAVWDGENPDFHLTDSNDTIITPSVAAADPNIDYAEWIEAEGGFSTYVFTSTVAGPWDYSLSGIGASNPISYTLHVYPETDLTLQASASEWQVSGTPAVITATFTSGSLPMTGIVTAALTLPDLSHADVTFQDNGQPPDAVAADGIYSALFQDTSQPGLYSTMVVANGNYPSQYCLRTASTYFLVSPYKAVLSGLYSDHPVDVNHNGRYETLELQAGIIVTETGRFEISAVLEGGSEQFIDLATHVEDITTSGSHSMILEFSGEAIRSSGIDGPYKVKQITLFEEDSLLLLDKEDSSYTTNSYNHLLFGLNYTVHLPVILKTLPNLLFTGTETERVTNLASMTAPSYSTVTDNNGNYLFSNLPEGSYTLIPLQNGQVFSPAFRTVNIPPDLSNQNFTRIAGPSSSEMVYIPTGEFQMGSYPADTSPYGVSDLAGNVWEWVNDWWQKNYYNVSPYSNPPGPTTGEWKVLRGGGFYYSWEYLRVASRDYRGLSIPNPHIGIRCAASQ